MISKIGELVGKETINRVSRKFEGLEEALEHLYWWEEEFSVEKTDDTVTSKGVCPIYERYPEWCENGCMSFARDMADEYGYSVERTKRRPDDRVCEFEFKKK